MRECKNSLPCLKIYPRAHDKGHGSEVSRCSCCVCYKYDERFWRWRSLFSLSVSKGCKGGDLDLRRRKKVVNAAMLRIKYKSW